MTLRGGVNDLQDGVDLLGLGGVDLLDAIDQLTVGADQVHGGTSQVATGAKDLGAGASKLANGSSDLATGAGQLDAGVGMLADGAGQLDDGAAKLEDGAGQLSDGLADAAGGTSQLAAGLTDAAAGAPQLKDGAQRLSDEGTKKLVEAGKATAADYGEKYALIEVGARRAKAEGMAYGAPEGAVGATAYSYELAGVDGAGLRQRRPRGRCGGRVRPRGWLRAAEATLPLTARCCREATNRNRFVASRRSGDRFVASRRSGLGAYLVELDQRSARCPSCLVCGPTLPMDWLIKEFRCWQYPESCLSVCSVRDDRIAPTTEM